jgi:hypothetical protein
MVDEISSVQLVSVSRDGKDENVVVTVKRSDDYKKGRLYHRLTFTANRNGQTYKGRSLTELLDGLFFEKWDRFKMI